MTSEPSCGEAMIALLRDYGVDTVFGMPGVHTLEFYRGLGAAGMRHVLFRHEQGGGFMADGYARASGRVGVCLVITGPGVTNAATAIGQAYSDSSPVLLVSSVNASTDLGTGRGRLHEVTDQRAVMEPLTAFAETLRSPGDAPAVVARAFGVFASARPRPCHIEVPLDVLSAPAGFEPRRAALPGRPSAPAAAVEGAARRCASAARPVIIAGGGAAGAGAPLARLAERLDAPVLTTIAGKGVLPRAHPLHAGCLLAQAAGRELVAGADLVVAVGTELSETDCWVERLPVNAPLVRIDIDAGKPLRDYPAAELVRADAVEAIELMLQALPVTGPAGSDGERRAARARSGARDEFGASTKGRRHLRVLEAMREVLPSDGLVSTDMTQLAYTANGALEVDRPRSYLHPVGYGTLGFGVPAAIGAALAVPERPVLALCGDAGLLFTIGELATAVDEGVSLPVVLWNNDGLGQIRDEMARRGIQGVGVSPRNPDYLALAHGFGAGAVRADSAAGFQKALEEAWQASGPTLIEIREDSGWLAD